MMFDKISFGEATKVEKIGMVETIVVDNVKDNDLREVICNFLEKEIEMITKKYEKSKETKSGKKTTDFTKDFEYILGIMQDKNKIYHSNDFVKDGFSSQKLVNRMKKLIELKKIEKVGKTKENKLVGYRLITE